MCSWVGIEVVVGGGVVKYRIDPCMSVLMDLESRGRRPRVINPLEQSLQGPIRLRTWELPNIKGVLTGCGYRGGVIRISEGSCRQGVRTGVIN